MLLRTDCKFFRGDIPCKPHKQDGVHCENCPHYQPVSHRILIIKLGALGDVIRTTPILEALRKAYPNALIYWITYSVDILPNTVDKKLPFTAGSTLVLEETEFDIAFNFDKDLEACSLLKRVKAKKKKGFTLEHGVCTPIDEDAQHKFFTGVFDDVSKANTKSYPQEIFEIAGLSFSGQAYQLDNSEAGQTVWPLKKGKQVIGLNTGCGERWLTRLWPNDYWQALISGLLKSGYEVVLLGGASEHEKNQALANATGAKYFGHFPLKKFIDLIDQCDIVITQVTMAMHLAIGRKKRLILMNNIFNKHEFELYGHGEILEPSTGCDCFYLANCKREAEGGVHCMRDILPGEVLSAVERQAQLAQKTS